MTYGYVQMVEHAALVARAKRVDAAVRLAMRPDQIREAVLMGGVWGYDAERIRSAFRSYPEGRAVWL
jgi:hypothetical protein